MQFSSIISFLLPLLFALGVSAQDDVTSVMTYYTTFTVSRVVETTTCTSTTTASSSTSTSLSSTLSTAVASSKPTTSLTTQLLTQTVQRMVATSASSSAVWVPSASAAVPQVSTNGTSVAVASAAPTATMHPYTGAASGLTVQVGAAALIAAVAGVAQML